MYFNALNMNLVNFIYNILINLANITKLIFLNKLILNLNQTHQFNIKEFI